MLAVLLTLASHDVQAEMTVLSSTSNSVEAGASVDEATSFAIEDGAEVQILRVEQGTTHVIKGPFSGTLSEYEAKAADCGILDFFSGDCGDQGGNPTGGMRDVAPPPDSSVGGVRGITQRVVPP